VKSTQIPSGNKNTFVGIAAHEFGHNLGLKHDNGNACGKKIFKTQCPSLAYGGAHSIMGGSNNLAPINAIHQEDLGWMIKGQHIINVTGEVDQVFTIQTMESQSYLPRAIKIKRGDGANYYIEYHQIQGLASIRTFDHSALYNGFKVYVKDETSINDSVLLRTDMVNLEYRLKDHRLGEEYYNFVEAIKFAHKSDFTTEFYDSVNHIKVKLEQKSDSSIQLRVITGKANIDAAKIEEWQDEFSLYPLVTGVELERYRFYQPKLYSINYGYSELRSIVESVEYDMDNDGVFDLTGSTNYNNVIPTGSFYYGKPGHFIMSARVTLKTGEVIIIKSKEFEIVDSLRASLFRPKASVSSELTLNQKKASLVKLELEFGSDFVIAAKDKIKVYSSTSRIKVKKAKRRLARKIKVLVLLPPQKKLSSYDIKDGYYEFELKLYLQTETQGTVYYAIPFKVKVK
jgi:hypothetical protein